MIHTLILVVCLSHACESSELWAVKRWTGPEAASRCEHSRQAHEAMAEADEKFLCVAEEDVATL